MARPRTATQLERPMETYVVRPPEDLSEALREELLGFREVRGWISAAVTRRDGLAIQHTFASGREAASLCAMAAALVGSARSTGNELEQGPFSYGIVQYSDGVLLVMEAGTEAILACLMEREVNLGAAMVKMARVARRIAERLETL